MNLINVKVDDKGNKLPYVAMLDDKMANLGTLNGWLNTDAMLFPDCVERISIVLDGQKDSENFWGNGYNVDVSKDFTEIHFNFEDDDPTIEPCKISTELFAKVVEMWLKYK